MMEARELLAHLIDIVKDIEMDYWPATRVERIMYQAREIGIDTNRPRPKLSETIAAIRKEFGAEFDAIDVDEFMRMVRPGYNEEVK